MLKHIKFYKSKQKGFAFWCDERNVSMDEFLESITKSNLQSIHITDADGGERVHVFWFE
jgi:hypothetical protein